MTSESGFSRRTLIKTGAALLGGLALAGCASDTGTGGGGSSDAAGTGASGGAPAPLPAKSVDELSTLAKAEGGQVLWYAGGAPDTEAALQTAFQQKYPFMTLNITSIQTSQRPQKIVIEDTTNAPTADFVTLNISERKTLVPSNIAVPVEIATENELPASTRDETHYSHPWYQLIVSPVYNKTLLPSLPGDPKGLADPSFARKIAFDRVQNVGQSFLWLSRWRLDWGDEEWTKWLEGLQANEIFLTGSSGDAFDAATRGERALAIGGSGDIAAQGPDGPMLADYSYDPIPFVQSLWLLRRAQNPAGAQLFFNYVFSAEGQKVVADTGRTPLRPGIDSPVSVESILAGTGSQLVPLSDLNPIYDDIEGYLGILENYWPV